MKRLYIFILFIIIFLTPINVRAVILSDAQGSYSLSRSIEYLEDHDKRLTIKDIASDKYSFIKNMSDVPNLGDTYSGYWFRIRLKNDSNIREWFFNIKYPILSRVDLYIHDKLTNEFKVYRSGASVPYSRHPVKKRNIMFTISLDKGEEADCYFYVETLTVLKFPLFIESFEAMDMNSDIDNLFYGFFLGCMIFAAIFNLFIFMTLKDRNYLYYTAHLIALMIFFFNTYGFFNFYLASNTPISYKVTPISIFYSEVFILLFSVSFLDIKRNSPIMYRFCLFLITINSLLGLSFVFSDTFFGSNYRMVIFAFTMISSYIIITILIIQLYKKGFRQTKYFLIAWGALQISGTIAFCILLRFIEDYKFFQYLVEYTIIIETMAFSFALADRYYLLNSELLRHKDAIIQHIEYRRKTESELMKTQKIESIAALASGIAHDLANILTGLFMKITMAQNKILSAPDTAREYLRDSSNIFKLAKNILYRLQAFSVPDIAKKELISIEKLIMETCSLVLSGSNSKYELIALHKQYSIQGDETQLAQAFTNLLINADQSMPDGGTINIILDNISLKENDIPCLVKGEYVRITVKDKGCGIPAENLGRIFDPFYSTKSRGRGLGLSSVYFIVKNHGGYIDVESKVGLGTNFHIYFPAGGDEFKDKPKLMADINLFRPVKILIMDDNEMLIDSVSTTLTERGNSVGIARNGYEAISMYKEAKQSVRPYDLVILDIIIPNNLSGIATMKQLQEIDPEVIAIISSGYNETSILSNYHQYGFSAALPKPYTIEELLVLISEIV